MRNLNCSSWLAIGISATFGYGDGLSENLYEEYHESFLLKVAMNTREVRIRQARKKKRSGSPLKFYKGQVRWTNKIWWTGAETYSPSVNDWVTGASALVVV